MFNVQRAMSGVRFPCRPTDPNKGYPAIKGEPLRARTCKCGPHHCPDEDGLCSLCGYWPKSTVDETWEKQAKIQGGARPVSSLDEYRKALYERQFGAAA